MTKLIDLLEGYPNNRVKLTDVAERKISNVFSNSRCLSAYKNSIVVSKEDLGISDNNLILQDDAFPANPTIGQVVSIGDKMYKYVGISRPDEYHNLFKYF